jgi:hypothetical protein
MLYWVATCVAGHKKKDGLFCTFSVLGVPTHSPKGKFAPEPHKNKARARGGKD